MDINVLKAGLGLIFIILLGVKSHSSSSQGLKFGSCYSKAPSEFLSCTKDSCETEILNKYTLFRVNPHHDQLNLCNSCYSKKGEAFSSCVKADCSLLIVDKAIEVALKIFLNLEEFHQLRQPRARYVFRKSLIVNRSQLVIIQLARKN